MPQHVKFIVRRVTTTQIFQIGIQIVPLQIQQLIPARASIGPIDTTFLCTKIRMVDRRPLTIIRPFRTRMFIINQIIRLQAMLALTGNFIFSCMTFYSACSEFNSIHFCIQVYFICQYKRFNFESLPKSFNKLYVSKYLSIYLNTKYFGYPKQSLFKDSCNLRLNDAYN